MLNGYYGIILTHDANHTMYGSLKYRDGKWLAPGLADVVASTVMYYGVTRFDNNREALEWAEVHANTIDESWVRYEN